MKSKLQVKDITGLTGVDRETLRFYEKKGLLPKPVRTDSGYRQFAPEVVVRLKFIKLAQDVGFSLREITELLKMGQQKAVTRKDLKLIADSKISSIDQRIASLKEMRKILVDFSSRPLSEYKKSTCSILSELNFTEG
ncbi:MAG: MerR family DNA-binding protein [Bdellovibrionaceae bacterium]|nr:MerR family DNA-binding protein [Pseudobdellovibrionaceae bacterium]